MRLFSALLPPPDVVAHLADWLAEHTADLPAGPRWEPVERWHITLGFFGDGDDPVNRTKWLRRRTEGRPAPTLRLVGAGTFPGVLWAGVSTGDDRLLAQLARAAGAGRRNYTPHLTLARWRSGQPETTALTNALAGYSGPRFTPESVSLMRSETGAGGLTYTAVARLPLAAG
ncbi:MAG TPA: RNA 2',3'-cyclic phosphodiesterase [Pseudonocardiaceae bacterium]|nr:RNA 2',3'-cyclic phosphodiesterase [Pseudonocardiaceae bacterium]